MPILGTDHSHYDWETQDGLYCPIDYDTAYKNGSRFTFLKVVNGAVVQSHAPDELKRAMASPLLAAPYNWPFPLEDIPAEVQAKARFDALGKLSCPFVEDFEETIPYASRDPNGKDLKAVIQAYWKLDPGRKFAIYTRWDYWVTHVDITDPFWDQFTMWWATGDSEPPTVPWDFWQDGGSLEPAKFGVYGGKKKIDTNWTNWSMEKLQEWFGDQSPIEPPIEPPANGGSMITYQGTVLAKGLHVRTGPDTSYPDARAGLIQEDRVEADRVENGYWWHLTKINGAVITGSCWSSAGLTGGYIRTDAIIEVPPSTEPVKVHDIEVYSDGKISIDGGARQ